MITEDGKRVGLYKYGKSSFHIGIIHSTSFITGLCSIHETEFSVRCSKNEYMNYIDSRCLIKKL